MLLHGRKVLMAIALMMLLAGHALAEGIGSHNLPTLGSLSRSHTHSLSLVSPHTVTYLCIRLPLFGGILTMLERAQHHWNAVLLQESCIVHTSRFSSGKYNTLHKPST